jgi:hypothetical protein
MATYSVTIKKAGWRRLLVSAIGRFIADWGTGAPSTSYGWPPSFVELTTRDGTLVQTLAGPMELYEAEQLAAQVRADLITLDEAEFEQKYFG